MIKQPNISPIDGLVDLACRDGVDVRPTLLRVLTDLYVQKPVHSADETTQYVELALGLVDTVDEATRAAVKAILSQYPAAPAPVLDKLGLDKPTTDKPALDRPGAAGFAPASRAALPSVTFVPDSAAPEPIAEAAPQQPAMPASVAAGSLTDIFLNAPPADRRLILANLDVVADPAALVTSAPNDIVMRLEEAALKREPAAFARLLESALGIDRALAYRMIEDTSGEPIVIAARALGIRSAVLQRILLFINPAVGQSVERVFDLADLYDEISLATASHMVALWRHDAPAIQRKGRHESMYQEDARTVRRPAARETRRADRSDAAASHKSAG